MDNSILTAKEIELTDKIINLQTDVINKCLSWQAEYGLNALDMFVVTLEVALYGDGDEEKVWMN